ncbi:MAG TPA: nitroreductase family protein [Verrucomicrobiae bacterium]|nr:nitroreductase family protein [Verrucomicrobiae bacterium]
MNVKEAILARRSIRKFKPDPVPDELILELLEGARLAPSGTNHQPWRFIVVKNEGLRQQIRLAAFNQRHTSEAPVLLVCCADLQTYARDTRRRIQELVDAGVLGPETFDNYPGIDQTKDMETLKKMVPHAMLNVAIAMEHIALQAVSMGLGTCWVQLMKAKEIARILSLPENLVITALMPLGYPDGDPKPRPRVALEEIYQIVE